MEEIGKIFSKDEANNLYGAVQQSKDISSSELASLFSGSKNYLMFKIINNQLVILGDKRVVLYPAGYKDDNKEVFAVYSISKIQELLNTGKAVATTVEQRSEVISINNGEQTLEMMHWCPPYCD
jgi:hypothetical protein